MGRNTKPCISGLERFGLNKASLRHLGDRRMQAYVYLRTYDVTPAVRQLSPAERHAYLSQRIDRWIDRLRRSFPKLSFQIVGKLTARRRWWWNLPGALEVRCSARELMQIAKREGVSSVHVAKVAGFRPRTNAETVQEWYCVRALVVIRVEGATSGLQSTEDRFVLVRASSHEDADKRLRRQWIKYASPYLNSDGQIVSWQLDRVVDVYETGETEIDPAGTEVYSRLTGRRMRPAYIWHPPRSGPVFRPKR